MKEFTRNEIVRLHFGGASQASALADLEDVVTVDVDVP